MKRRWQVIVTILVGLLVLAVTNGHIFYVDFPYRGQIIDAETKQPIEGAAVVEVWWVVTLNNFVQGVVSFYEAHETVTDQEGNFTTGWIWGGSLNPLQKLEPPLFTIFKPGFESMRARRFTNPASRWWRSVRSIVELRRLTTRQERLRNSGVHPGSKVPDGKIPNLIRLINFERSELEMKRKRRKTPSPSSKSLEALPPPASHP